MLRVRLILKLLPKRRFDVEGMAECMLSEVCDDVYDDVCDDVLSSMFISFYYSNFNQFQWRHYVN
jgi:hypothetical protein